MTRYYKDKKLRWYHNNWGEVMGDVIAVYLAITVVAVFLLAGIVSLFLTDGVEYGPYRCEDRGGIKQIGTNKYGDVDSLLCNDGTIQSSTQKIHGVRWKWNRPEGE